MKKNTHKHLELNDYSEAKLSAELEKGNITKEKYEEIISNRTKGFEYEMLERSKECINTQSQCELDVFFT